MNFSTLRMKSEKLIQVGEQTHENKVCMHIIGLLQTPLILSTPSLSWVLLLLILFFSHVFFILPPLCFSTHYCVVICTLGLEIVGFAITLQLKVLAVRRSLLKANLVPSVMKLTATLSNQSLISHG